MIRQYLHSILFISCALCYSLIILQCQTARHIPSGFVYVNKQIPDLQYELRYYSTNNFMGRRVTSYEDSVLILSDKAASQLKKVQDELSRQQLGLKVFDAYRPQSAVNDFISWSKDSQDTLMKKQYYPALSKEQLFPLGYISTRSGHTRGSTVDLTIVRLSTGDEIDMGGPYDFFGEISHHSYTSLPEASLSNRKLLKRIMMKHGFKPYENEWWHYTLMEEPYPDTYFDFPIKK